MKLLRNTFLLVLSICMLSLGTVEAKAKHKKLGTSETFPEVAKCFHDADYSAELAAEVAIHLAFAAQNDKDPNIKNYARQCLHNWMKQVTHAKGLFVKHMDVWPKKHAKQFEAYLTKLADQGHEGLVAAEQFAKEVKIAWKAPADHKHRKKPESNKQKKKKEEKNNHPSKSTPAPKEEQEPEEESEEDSSGGSEGDEEEQESEEDSSGSDGDEEASDSEEDNEDEE